MAQSVLLVASTPIFNNLYARSKTELLKIGVNLSIFDILGEGDPKTANELAQRIQVEPNRLDRFLRSLVCIDLLELVNDNAYRNTPATTLYLVKSSPRYVGNCIKFLDMVWNETIGKLEDFLKDKKVANSRPDYDNMHLDLDVLKTFAEGMQAFGRADMDCLSLVDFSKCHTVVDLGGSLGWQARELRRLHPSISRIIIGELEEVVQIGSKMQENVEAGIEYKKMNFFADSLLQADAYILGHILHSYNETDVRSILKKVHNALNPGGLLVLLEAVLNHEKIGPFRSIFLDLNMLTFQSGAERSANEYKIILAAEGFEDFKFLPVDTSCQFDVIVVRKRSATDKLKLGCL